MGKDNKCKPIMLGKKGSGVYGCSKCNTPWTDGIPRSCPKCHAHVKLSSLTDKINQGKI